MTSIQVSIALPGRLTPERVSELVTMATSRLRWELCNRLVEQKRETRQRASSHPRTEQSRGTMARRRYG